MELHVGCPMWAHKPWQGRWLPEGLRRDEQLAAYATWCNAVEGNTTFYGLPSAEAVASWAAQVPEGFRLVAKVPKVVTHDRRLRGAGDELERFLEVLAPLGEAAATAVVQLPGTFGPSDLGALAAFLGAAPGGRRYAVEVRHPRFFDGSAPARALDRVLVDHGAERVVFDTTAFFAAPPTSDAEREAWSSKPRLPVRREALTDQPVVRYLGRDDPRATVAGWQPWVDVVAGWLAEGRRPTFFLHTPDNLDGPALARRFHDEVRARMPGVAPLPDPVRPEPTTLF